MQLKKKKILIADADGDIAKRIRKNRSSIHYRFETARDGFECLAKLDRFQPDLILIDQQLSKIHGIEILRKIKTDPRTHQVGVILMTAHPMIQNYRAALHLQCDYFLEKPFDISEVYTLFKRYFDHKLKPAAFPTPPVAKLRPKQAYLPKIHSSSAYIKFWGTRGSNSVSGAEYIRFGGNTCSLEIRSGEDLIIVDAGTGIRRLGGMLEEEGVKNIHLLISHTHWDHLAGFPFFAPIYDSKCTVNIWTPIGYEKTTRELFSDMLANAYFPVRLDDIQAKVIFKDIHEREPFKLGNIVVDTHYAYHPGPTICFKFQVDKTTFGYVTDNEFLMGFHGHPNTVTKNHPALHPYRSMINFFKGCDFLVHEAQYTPSEYLSKVGWGHSSVSNACVLIREAGIAQWIITHHDPKHTDVDLLEKMQLQFDILDDCKLSIRPRMAFDNMYMPL